MRDGEGEVNFIQEIKIKDGKDHSDNENKLWKMEEKIVE